jgi:predicted nucleic acid-binding protein
MRFVLDASIALCWCFEDESDEYALGVLRKLRSSEALVSSLWPTEVTNALATAERSKRIDRVEAASAQNLLLALPIAIDPVDRIRAFGDTPRLARAHGLTTYDASYLEVAVRLGIPIATLHGALAKAAADEGVPPV